MYFLLIIKLYIIFILFSLDIHFLKMLPIILPLLLAIAFFTVIERKILASVQRRRGPNIIGIYGILQAIADGLKLLNKETNMPKLANIFIFFAAPLLTIIFSFLSWAIIPISLNVVVADANLGLLLLFAISSLNIYGILISGWASNSKYAFLGSLRSAAQLVSYEISIGLIIMPILLLTKSANLTEIVLCQNDIYFFFPLFPSFILFFISALAETNRVPFDLPEAESELVSGFMLNIQVLVLLYFFWRSIAI
jgi:NADH-quinone oxidoreductase subunit H